MIKLSWQSIKYFLRKVRLLEKVINPILYTKKIRPGLISQLKIVAWTISQDVKFFLTITIEIERKCDGVC